MNKPSKLSHCTSQSILGSGTKRESLANQENKGGDKLEQIKRILGLKESNDVKIFLINEIVSGKKDVKVLAEKEMDMNAEKEEVF